MTDVSKCIIIGLYYFTLKLVNNGKCITATRGSLGYTCINRPLPGIVHYFAYNDSHLSLNQYYYYYYFKSTTNFTEWVQLFREGP